MAEQECKDTLEKKLVLPAYEWLLKCSHWFNMLDARGAISVTQRTGYITRIRNMAVGCAKVYLTKNEWQSLEGTVLKEEDIVSPIGDDEWNAQK